MRIKLSHPLSISPKVAFKPAGQLLTNLAAEHQSQILQVTPEGLTPEEKQVTPIMGQSWRKPGFCGSTKTSSCGNICFTGYFRASLLWMLWVFLSRHQTAHGQSKEHVDNYDPGGWECWVPTQRWCHLLTLVLPGMTQRRDTSPPSLPGHQVQGHGEGLVLGMPLMSPTVAAALPSGTSHALLLF